jgi:hypothetical protein
MPYYVNNIRARDLDFRKDSLITTMPVFVDHSKASDQRMANVMWTYGHLLEAYIRTKQKPSADECKKLVNMLSEKYDISGEK